MDHHQATQTKRQLVNTIRLTLCSLFFVLIIASPQASKTKLSRQTRNGYAQSAFFANLEGYVVSKLSNLPVHNAAIHIAPLGETLYSDENGYFSLYNIQIPEQIIPITATIKADGFGEWVLKDARLSANDTLILKPRLTIEPYLSIVPPPRALNPDWPHPDLITNFSTLATSDLSADQPIPKNIRVRISGYSYHCDTKRDYEVEIIDFKQYVKHVLPNEWALWSDDSLRAGAIAVKMYAWYWIALDGKWKDADVWDSTCDQVYNPNVEFASTNAAVEFTWNWVLSRDNKLVHTSYRSTYELCEDSNLEGNCMGQFDSEDLAQEGYTWSQILQFFYHDTELSVAIPPYEGGYAMRFNGTPGDVAENRVLIPIADPDNDDTVFPANIGASDFTIEWWMKADPNDNTAPPIVCGEHDNWIYGNVIYDRDRAGLPRGFGISLADNKIVFGINGMDGKNYTLCGQTDLADDEWHHLAIQRRRSDGYIWIYLDGQLDATVDGPDGNVSYPDNESPSADGDHFIGIGAWKIDNEHNLHPFFRGWVDELRLSKSIRYTHNFTPLTRPFTNDADTVALYHFDEGIGSLVSDSSNIYGGPSHGFRQYGGTIDGPGWVISDLFIIDYLYNYLPLVAK